jgi:hypothetical protein
VLPVIPNSFFPLYFLDVSKNSLYQNTEPGADRILPITGAARGSMQDGVPSSPERRSKIVQLYREGMTVRDLSHRFSVSYWTIRNELLAAANGGKLPDPHNKKAKNWRTAGISAA